MRVIQSTCGEHTGESSVAAPRRAVVPHSADSRRVASRRLVRRRADFRVYRRAVRVSVEQRVVSRPRSVPSRLVWSRFVSSRLAYRATSYRPVHYDPRVVASRVTFSRDACGLGSYLPLVCAFRALHHPRYDISTSTQHQSHEHSELTVGSRKAAANGSLITRRRTVPLSWECERRPVLAAAWSARTRRSAGNLTSLTELHTPMTFPSLLRPPVGQTSNRLSLFRVYFLVARPAHVRWFSSWAKNYVCCHVVTSPTWLHPFGAHTSQKGTKFHACHCGLPFLGIISDVKV